MKNILVIVDNYYPYFSPNGSCINNIIMELKKGNNVRVLCAKNNFKLKKNDEYNGIKITRVKDEMSSLHTWCNENISKYKNSIKVYVFKAILILKRITYAIKRMTEIKNINKRLVRKYFRAIEKIGIDKIDTIISVSAPYECTVAAYQIKQKYSKMNFLPLQIDNFVESNTLYKPAMLKNIKYNYTRDLEMSILKECDHLFIFPHLARYYEKNKRFQDYKDKITELDHPLLVYNKYTKTSKKRDPHKIKLIYTGSLNKKIRNPEYILELVLGSSIKDNVVFSMYTLGDCQEIIDRYQKKSEGRVKGYGPIPLEEMYEKTASSDILINIGVTTGDQISGKIFEYISLGKPIIHIYFADDDPNLKYLKQYPLVLCMKVDNSKLKENIKTFDEFCEKNKEKVIEFEEIYKLFRYATPEYSSSLIEKYLE